MKPIKTTAKKSELFQVFSLYEGERRHKRVGNCLCLCEIDKYSLESLKIYMNIILTSKSVPN
jgi:hypothetical protein